MAKVKIKMLRNCFVGGELYENEKAYSVDEKTGGYLIRIGRAVPGGTQTKEPEKKTTPGGTQTKKPEKKTAEKDMFEK